MHQNSDDMVWATQNIYTSPISSVDNAYSMTSSSQDSFSSNISEKVPSPDSTNTPGKPYLKIMEEPANQFRFRYKSEMQGTHGAILGARATKNEKTYPTVKLFNYDGDAVIRCTLYTAENKRRRPHVHRLVGKMSGRTEKDDPHDMRISQSDNHTACFQNLVIIHTAKKVLVDELLGKKKRIAEARFTQKLNIEEKLLGKMRLEAEQDAKGMNMNSVSLKFEAFSLVNQQYIQICEPVYSQPINNMKSHVTGQLRICRLSKFYSSCEGGEEILLFVEKVGKNNIKVLFTERDDYGNEVWRDYATHVEVHHQFGISCRCPKYKSQDICREVLVKMQLERPSDGATSETRDFVYKPAEYSNTSTKRRRLDSVVFTNPTPDSTCNPQMDRFGDDWQTVLPTGAAASVVLQSSNTDPLLRFIEPHRDEDDFVMIKDALLFSSLIPNEAMAESTNEENASSSISFSAEIRNYPTPPETMIPDVYSSEELQKAIQEDAIAPEYGELVPDRVYTRNLKPKNTGIHFQMADPDALVAISQAALPVPFPRERKTKDGITIAYPEGALSHPSNQRPSDELVTRVQAGVFDFESDFLHPGKFI
ncbi:nuclear factor NF-kappa-B p110 subunit isoform X2 [Nilaparvata lugens]|uniref:nuclear factor NF-kappa-B p110 subunit isoform X2 n=1 Tax=Nilaparvata lugens TaxID=108931 RepID=UPI00193CD8D0|nr:nuclear factor NF-kappa-B p110 subunit isoform X2 [Nilaparvata lugens]